MRGLPRWLALLAVGAVVGIAGAFSLHRAFAPAAVLVESIPNTLPADGFSTAQLKIHTSSGRALRDVQIEVDDPRRAAVESVTLKGETAVITVRAGVLAGEAKLQLSAPGVESNFVSLHTTLDVSDSVGDGTPDFLRLHDASDRAAFRRWFTLLAEAEYYRRGSSAEVNDCAAFLRHSYREALRRHDAAWARSATLPAVPSAGDIRQ